MGSNGVSEEVTSIRKSVLSRFKIKRFILAKYIAVSNLRQFSLHL